MAWECSQCVLSQDGTFDERMQLENDVRNYLKTLERAYARSYVVADDKEDYGSNNPEPVYAQEDRIPYQIDLRKPHVQENSAVQVLDPEIDPALYTFFEKATRGTVHDFWYTLIVSAYSPRRLTYPSDKLPALAGVASRISAVTLDDYLAGHWRTELERSLFWTTHTESHAGHPARVNCYRAPSWSWASVNSSVGWWIPDLDSDATILAPLEIMEANVDVDGSNPFGCVTGGRIIMKAHTLQAMWIADHSGWELKGEGSAYGEENTLALPILGSDGTRVGYWEYDDLINGILPGPPLSQDASLTEIHKRSVPRGYFGSAQASNIAIHGKEVEDAGTLWRRGTYVPENLLLVKGSTKQFSDSEKEWFGRGRDIEVLVLARTDGEKDEHRRVGVGRLAYWDDAAGRVQVLTVV